MIGARASLPSVSVTRVFLAESRWRARAIGHVLALEPTTELRCPSCAVPSFVRRSHKRRRGPAHRFRPGDGGSR